MSRKVHEFAFSFLFILYFSLARDDIHTTNISTDGTDHFIAISEFGFKTTGHLSITISSLNVIPPNNTTPTNLSQLGFFLTGSRNEIWDVECIMYDPEYTLLFTFSELPPMPVLSASKTILVKKPGYYDIYFGNCNPNSRVSMLVHIEAYNLDASGNKEYLSDGETQLPILFSSFALCYILFFIMWLYTCYSNKPFVKKIHLLMLALLLAKVLNLVLAAEDKYHVNVTGGPHGWDTWFYVFQLIKCLLLLLVIFLVGTGWSFLRPFLQEREKHILMIVIPLQVFVNIARFMYDEEMADPSWLFFFIMADLVCAILIVVPIEWSMASLVEASKEDEKAATNLNKMKLFRNFYLSAVSYLFFNNYIMLFITDDLRAPTHSLYWVSDLIKETTSLLFYIIMFCLFRPIETNQYLALPDDEDDEEVALETMKSLQIVYFTE